MDHSTPTATACMYCGSIQMTPNQWKPVKPVDTAHLSHSVCPDCYTIAIFRLLEEVHREVSAKAPCEGAAFG